MDLPTYEAQGTNMAHGPANIMSRQAKITVFLRKQAGPERTFDRIFQFILEQQHVTMTRKQTLIINLMELDIEHCSILAVTKLSFFLVKSAD